MDNQERKALIDSEIPKEHRSYFYRLIEATGFKVQHSTVPDIFAPHKAEPSILKSALLARSVTIFSTMLKWSDYQDVSSSQFYIAAKSLNSNVDNEDIYLDLTPAAQKFFIQLPKYATQGQDAGYIYLNLLSRVESLPDYSLMKSRYRPPGEETYENLLSFAEVVDAALEEVARNSQKEDIAARQDLTAPSPTLLTLMQVKTPPAFNRLDRNVSDVLFMCKMIYGEQTVIDFYEKFAEYTRRPLTAPEIFSILDDWQNLQSYPTDWIMEVGVR